VQSTTARATLRIEPTADESARGHFRTALHEARRFTLDCPHGVTEAETSNPDDGEVLAYAAAYHTSREGCQCAEAAVRTAAACWFFGKKKVSTELALDST
jgi:hypothetical protein